MFFGTNMRLPLKIQLNIAFQIERLCLYCLFWESIKIVTPGVHNDTDEKTSHKKPQNKSKNLFSKNLKNSSPIEKRLERVMGIEPGFFMLRLIIPFHFPHNNSIS